MPPPPISRKLSGVKPRRAARTHRFRHVTAADQELRARSPVASLETRCCVSEQANGMYPSFSLLLKGSSAPDPPVKIHDTSFGIEVLWPLGGPGAEFVLGVQCCLQEIVTFCATQRCRYLKHIPAKSYHNTYEGSSRLSGPRRR